MHKDNLFLTISTPHGILFYQEILSVNFLTDEGYITILRNHIPIIGNVYKCTISVKKLDGKILEYKADSGLFVKSKDNQLKLVLNSCHDDTSAKTKNNNNNKIVLKQAKTNNTNYVEITLNK